MLPVYAGAWALGSLLPESEFSHNSKTWGEQTIRGFIVGAPPVLLLQRATGGSRPDETAVGSEWQPFQDNNGVSGHAFMGALPFITAAKMSDKLGWKVTWYAASALAPMSRAADGAHYPSQVALGWGMAFLAATAVHTTDSPNARLRILPTATVQGSVWRWSIGSDSLLTWRSDCSNGWNVNKTGGNYVARMPAFATSNLPIPSRAQSALLNSGCLRRLADK